MAITKSIARFFNQPLGPPSLRHGYSEHIEQYRGLCALLVFIEHAAIFSNMVVNGSFKWPLYMEYLGAGHFSVIIFFCISGYVIGLNYDTKHLDIKKYIKKRLVRLYPIYFIAVVATAFLNGGYPLLLVIYNLLFLENVSPYIHFSVPIILLVTWSLNYEVVYYLSFIGLFFFKPKIWKLLLGMLFLTILLIHAGTTIVIFARFLNGFYIWLLGLMLAWGLFKFETTKNSFVPLLSMMFLQICFNHLDVGLIFVHLFKIDVGPHVDYIFDIPFCLMIMCILISKDNAFLRFNKIFCYALPAFIFISLIITNRIFEDTRWIMCLIAWVLSLLFYQEKKISAFLLQKLTGVGKISYGIYLLHIPVGMLLKKVTFSSNITIEVIIKYILWFGLTFALAILLELRVQPRIKNYFFSKPH